MIAPHADDEVLGCGGLISKIKGAGGKVFVLIFNVGSIEKFNNKNKQLTVVRTSSPPLAGVKTVSNLPAVSKI